MTTQQEYISIQAGGAYGSREAIYQVVADRLVLRDEGDHDNLAGNNLVLAFEGFTLDQASKKCEALNSEGSGHAYDGCHACTWSISCQPTDAPPHLTYREPPEAAVIKAALAAYHDAPK